MIKYITSNKNSLINNSIFFDKKCISRKKLNTNKYYSTKTNLPVLDSLVDYAIKNGYKSLDKTAIIYIHHPLKTSFDLMNSFFLLGAKPENVFVLGKPYSENKDVVNKIKETGVFYRDCSSQIGLGKFKQTFTRDINWLWSDVTNTIKGKQDTSIEKIIVLDHGGFALNYIPKDIIDNFKVIGIEKTSSGLFGIEDDGLPPFPLIGVANCAAKRILESPLIAQAVVDKLTPMIPEIKNNSSITFGVVGYGAIGKGITEKLVSMGHKVMVYDCNAEKYDGKLISKVPVTSDLSTLISFSDFIFGCTGRNITESIEPFRLATKDKVLISCSSGDVEFLSLLKKANKEKKLKDPLNEVIYETDFGAKIKIIKGGFPVNFDNTGESVPAKDIQLTRALVLGSVIQATEMLEKEYHDSQYGFFTLNPSIQKFIVEDWIKYQPKDRFKTDILNNFKNEEWIRENSLGDIPLKIESTTISLNN